MSWSKTTKTTATVLAVYTLLAIAVMAPLAPKALPLTGASDIGNHVSGIIEARNALAEGQFPIRVPPHQNQNERYALFQFYGNFPYTVGGLIYLITDSNPYKIWKWVVTAFLVLGGYFTFGMVRSLTRETLPSIGAGATFLTAPYMLTDIHGRVAFPEVVSFALLPMVLFFAWRSFAGRGVWVVLASGIAWSCLSLSHNITLFYGSLYIGLFFASFASLRKQLLTRWLRVAVGYALGMVLTLWYIAPQQQLLPQIRQGLATYMNDYQWLTPLGVLLAPTVALPDHFGTMYISCQEHFGLQVGWPILIGVGVALFYLREPSTGWGVSRAVLTRIAVLYGLSLFMVWTPFNFWKYLPAIFSYVQFSYRLLMFVVLFGSVLVGYALARSAEGRARPVHLAMVLLGLGWTAAPYVGPHRADPDLSVSQEIATPNIGRGGACAFYAPSAQALVGKSYVHPSMNWVAVENGGVLDPAEFGHGNNWAVFPQPVEGDRLKLEGEVIATSSPLRLTIGIDNVIVATPELPPGPFKWSMPLLPSSKQDHVQVVVHGPPILVPLPPPHSKFREATSYVLTKFSLETERSNGLTLVNAGQLMPQMRWGHPTVVDVHVDKPSLVQLPVVYYPNVLHLELNGQPVAPRHLGRFVALELPPGDHHIAVSFVGLRWANYLSLAAWIGVGVVSLGCGFVQLRAAYRIPNQPAPSSGG